MRNFSFEVRLRRKTRAKSIVQQVTLLGILTLLIGCKPHTDASPAGPEILALGAEVFEMNCAQCHYDGSATETMPALKGSPALAGPAGNAIRIILNGQRGVSQVNGHTLGGIMPSQNYLSNSEIAAVVTYIRAEFSSGGAPVSEAEVEALR